jgi:uncharacterized protein YigE (DUF2233 family)
VRHAIVRRIAFLLAAVTSFTAYDHSALADTGPCHSMEFERTAYAICEVDLHKHTVRLYWNRSDGTPYAYLSALPRFLEGGAARLLFATNVGTFAIPTSSLWACTWNRDANLCAQTPIPAGAIFT